MDLLQLYLISGALIIIMMTALWLVSLALKNSSIVDIFWGAGFVVVAWSAFFLSPQAYAPRSLLLNLLVTLWGLRLALHIFLRNHGKGEDFRYRAWREEAGPSWWWRSFIRVFLLQGVILWIVAAPLVAVHAAAMPAHLTWLDVLALPVWLIGFFFEAGGDFQLARFKADPANRGKVLRSGVWSVTRHPNYFGDSVQWWAYYLVAAAAGAWWTVFSPALMTFLLVRVSGVAMLERTLVQEKPEYRDYVESTSAFIPWFPRRRAP